MATMLIWSLMAWRYSSRNIVFCVLCVFSEPTSELLGLLFKPWNFLVFWKLTARLCCDNFFANVSHSQWPFSFQHQVIALVSGASREFFTHLTERDLFEFDITIHTRTETAGHCGLLCLHEKNLRCLSFAYNSLSETCYVSPHPVVVTSVDNPDKSVYTTAGGKLWRTYNAIALASSAVLQKCVGHRPVVCIIFRSLFQNTVDQRPV